MTQLINQYNALASEVSDYQAYILNLSKNDTVIKDVYRGCQILYSPLIPQPDIMFVGINPGPGYYNLHKILVDKLEPQPILEYLDENEDYLLLKDTIDVFEIAEKTHLLSNSVKSNHCYFATNNSKMLGILTNKLYGYGQDPWATFNQWTAKLIKMIEPKTLLCEGFSAFNSTCQALGLDQKHEIPVTESIKLLSNDEYKVIGYKRLRSGRILNKSELGQFLSQELS